MLLSLALLSLQNQNEVTDGALYSAGVETKGYYRENCNLIYCVPIYFSRQIKLLCYLLYNFVICDLFVLYWVFVYLPV